MMARTGSLDKISIFFSHSSHFSVAALSVFLACVSMRLWCLSFSVIILFTVPDESLVH